MAELSASNARQPPWACIRHGRGAQGCDCQHAPTGLEQSVEELDFVRSACSAAQNGETEKLRRMLDRNPGVHLFSDGGDGSSGYTPLHYAARNGHAECVTLLLQAGAEVDASTAGGATSLHRAAFAGHERIVALLLRASASAAVQDSDGDTPLLKATARGHAAAARLLVRASPEAADLANKRGQTPRSTASGELATLFAREAET